MGFYRGPDLVRDGLIIAYDAGATRSYPGTGTTLTDLSKNGNTSTLTNGPTYSTDGKGSITLDGSDDYIITSNTPAELQGDPALTVSMWVKRLSDEVVNTGPWGLGGNVTNQGINGWWQNNNNEIAIDTWGQATFTTGVEFPLNEWVFATWQKNAGAMTRANCTLWKNTTSYSGNDLTVLRAENVAPNINNNGFVLGRISNSYNVPVNFRYSHVFVYNRVLSSDEVIKNYNALKSRYE